MDEGDCSDTRKVIVSEHADLEDILQRCSCEAGKRRQAASAAVPKMGN